MRARARKCPRVCMCERVSVCVNESARECVCASVCECVRACVRACVYARTRTHVNASYYGRTDKPTDKLTRSRSEFSSIPQGQSASQSGAERSARDGARRWCTCAVRAHSLLSFPASSLSGAFAFRHFFLGIFAFRHCPAPVRGRMP